VLQTDLRPEQKPGFDNAEEEKKEDRGGQPKF
jgi:hypothetical protein